MVVLQSHQHFGRLPRTFRLLLFRLFSFSLLLLSVLLLTELLAFQLQLSNSVLVLETFFFLEFVAFCDGLFDFSFAGGQFGLIKHVVELFHKDLVAWLDQLTYLLFFLFQVLLQLFDIRL